MSALLVAGMLPLAAASLLIGTAFVASSAGGSPRMTEPSVVDDRARTGRDEEVEHDTA
jgi:hypothetical protein